MPRRVGRRLQSDDYVGESVRQLVGCAPGPPASSGGSRLGLVWRLEAINRFLRGRRRTTSLVGIVIVLGVGALSTHAALPEHHFNHDVATLCVASVAIATMAMIAWPRGRTPALTATLARTCDISPGADLAGHRPDAAARAGPSAPLVLRI